MFIRRRRSGKTVSFADPPWNEDSPQWQELDQELAPDHLGRLVVASIEALDLSALYASYSGVGSKPYRPDLMLRIALIEIQRGRHSPTHWFQDTLENNVLRWAAFGIQPSRTCWHDFFDRAAPCLEAWNHMVLNQAQERGLTRAERAAQDGSLVAANASRHRLLNQERLEKRLTQLDAALGMDPAAPPPQSAGALETVSDAVPGWMARTPTGRLGQRRRYVKAQDHLQELLSANARRNPAKRREPKKIVVSGSDPESVPNRDKEKVFRPLYNVQLLCDLDSPFILGYDVLARSSDAGTLEPMLERVSDLVGHKPRQLLADATYVTGADLALCHVAGVTLYGPWMENDFSGKAAKYLDKRQFTWLPEENAYRCPQGHRLTAIGKERRQHTDGRSEMHYRYRCAGALCRTCPLQTTCARNPARGRSLRRSEYEDLIEAHKARMDTPEAKELYKLRKQTVELNYADFKEHRRLRRFWGRGVNRAQAQVGFAVLAHNLLALAHSPTPSENQLALIATSRENGP